MRKGNPETLLSSRMFIGSMVTGWELVGIRPERVVARLHPSLRCPKMHRLIMRASLQHLDPSRGEVPLALMGLTILGPSNEKLLAFRWIHMFRHLVERLRFIYIVHATRFLLKELF